MDDGERADGLFQRRRDGARVGAQPLEDARDDALRLAHERQQQMLRLDLRIVALLGQVLRAGDGLARLLGPEIGVHKQLLYLGYKMWVAGAMPEPPPEQIGDEDGEVERHL